MNTTEMEMALKLQEEKSEKSEKSEMYFMTLDSGVDRKTLPIQEAT